MQCTPRQRRHFVGFVMICVFATYLYGALSYGVSWYAASLWAFVLYAKLWFAHPAIGGFWITSHTLFVLTCRWLIRSDELRTYFFTMLLACIISYWGALSSGILIYSTIMGHKAIPF